MQLIAVRRQHEQMASQLQSLIAQSSDSLLVGEHVSKAAVVASTNYAVRLGERLAENELKRTNLMKELRQRNLLLVKTRQKIDHLERLRERKLAKHRKIRERKESLNDQDEIIRRWSQRQ